MTELILIALSLWVTWKGLAFLSYLKSLDRYLDD